jgi:hypothetical protein
MLLPADTDDTGASAIASPYLPLVLTHPVSGLTISADENLLLLAFLLIMVSLLLLASLLFVATYTNTILLMVPILVGVPNVAAWPVPPIAVQSSLLLLASWFCL